MARTRMVTRTVNVTEVTALILDVKTTAIYISNFELSGETYTIEEALKVLKKKNDTDLLKVVAIQSMSTTEELYGMLETDFIASACKLDKETRKILASEEETTEEATEEVTEQTETK